MGDLTVHVDDCTLPAAWTDENPETRAAIRDALPLEGRASRWGDELYFRTPVDAPEELAREQVPVGSLAYWPRGDALCLFWGPTPASHDDEPRAASPVNVVARIHDVSPLVEVDDSAHMRIE